MSFKKTSKHKYKKNNNKYTKKMIKKGGIGPSSIYNSIKSFVNLNTDVMSEMNTINNLKKQMEDNSYKMKENVNKYYSIYNQLYKKTQSLYSKIDTLKSLQSQCSNLYPNVNNTNTNNTNNTNTNNTDNDPLFLIKQRFNEAFNKTKDTIEKETEELKTQSSEYVSNVANNIPFTTASKLQSTIDQLKREIVTLNEEISDLKKKHESEQLMLASALKTPVSEVDLENLNNISSDSSSSESNTPSVLENIANQTQQSTVETTGEPVGEPVGETAGETAGETTGETLGETAGEPVEETVGETILKPNVPPMGLSSQPPTWKPTGGPGQPPTWKPTGNTVGKTISEITDIPKTPQNEIPQQNGGRINYNNISKKKKI